MPHLAFCQPLVIAVSICNIQSFASVQKSSVSLAFEEIIIITGVIIIIIIMIIMIISILSGRADARGAST